MNNPHTNLKNSECKNVKFLGTMVHDFSSNSKFSKGSIEEVLKKSQSLTTNVHVNPKFKPLVPVIHINPKIKAKPLIHINPKMMHNIANSNQNIQNNATVTTKTDTDSNTAQINIKRSIYVNPTLLKNLSSSSKVQSANLKEPSVGGQPTCLGLTPVKNTSNRKVTPKKFSDSRVVVLSRRKLVRITRAANSVTETSSISQHKLQKFADLTEKKTDNLLHRTIKVPSLVNNTLQSTSIKCNEIQVPKSGITKSKVTKYKIDRTVLNIPKIKKRCLIQKTRKIINDNVELVTIGGIVYKSSKNRLIRKSCSLKRKRSINGNNNKLVATNNGTKSKSSKGTLNHMVEANASNKTRFTSNISSKITYKNNISNKIKQKSIQILRNKMHKNNQPCLIFQRFGYCLNHKNGLCPKRHDKKQVSICKKFLQGKCLLDKCPLSHDVGPEKMPTCKYFLDGCCTRDACPYLHVKVSSNTSICIDFLQGYCAKGNECHRRHEYLCPDFDKSGNCSKGKYCPYPHKLHSSNTEENTKYLSKIMHSAQEHQAISDAKHDSEISNIENRLRYYEQTHNSSDNLEKKKENILEKIKIMKSTLNKDQIVESASQVQVNETNKSLIKKDKVEVVKDVESNIKRRIPIGSLPAYIPIN